MTSQDLFVAYTKDLRRIAKSRLMKNQNHKCKICNEMFSSTHRPDLDHDHKTGLVRDVLCHSCNVGLGNFQDNPNILARAMNYLLIHQIKQELATELHSEASNIPQVN